MWCRKDIYGDIMIFKRGKNYLYFQKILLLELRSILERMVLISVYDDFGLSYFYFY